MPHESQVTQRLHKLLRERSSILCTKMQLQNFIGFPDALYRKGPLTLFVEYKVIPALPVRATTLIQPKLSPHQVQWLKEHKQQNGLGLVIVYAKKDKAFIVMDSMHDWEYGLLLSDCLVLKGYNAMADWLINYIEDQLCSSIDS